MNVVFISIDTLRADHLSCYGYHRLTSPHIDHLAAQGVVFEECFSPYIPTHPGYTTTFTGKDVMSHQIVTQGGAVEPPAGVRMLAELMREAGYFTAAADNLGRWFNLGYDVYQPFSWSTDPQGAWRKGEAVNQVALPLLEQCLAQARPFFMFVHYWDPHTPYLPPPPFDRMFWVGDERDESNHSMDPVFAFEPFKHYFAQWMGEVRDIRFPIAQYDAEIAYVDTCLNHLLERVDASGKADETLVVIHSDHGEELDEHAMWFDHHGLYDTNLHVPFIMRCPGRLPAGLRLKGFVRTTDMAPTILDLIGRADLAQREGMQGQSMLPLIDKRSRAGTCRELCCTECAWQRKRALRTRRWKLIQALEPDPHGTPLRELYDLQADPREQRNVIDEHPETARRMERRLMRWARRRARETGLPDPMETQSITLRQIGKMATAVPTDQKLTAE